jgi:hypothetical protein
MVARSIAEQTGWNRPHPMTMLQGFDTALELLLRITEWDFDLSDPGFVFYCKQRGTLYLVGEPGTAWWQMVCDFSRKEVGPGAGLDTKYLLIARGRLQDCWEMYLMPEAAQIMRLYCWLPDAPYQRNPSWEPPARQRLVPPVVPATTRVEKNGQLAFDF